MDRLSELAAFIAVVDHGGFSAAAKVLRISTPSVSRMVARLEERVDLKLLDRSARRCVLTQHGVGLVEQARAIVRDYDDALEQAGKEARSPKGKVRLTAPYFFGREHVAPAVVLFLREHPGISVELDLDDRLSDLHASGFDLAVRIGPFDDETLRAVRVGWVGRMIVASPTYLAAHGCPESPAELQSHRRIQHGTHSDAPWRLRGAKGRSLLIPTEASFTVNQADAALAAAREGHGLVTALSYQVHADLASGALVRVMAEFEPEPLPVRLCWPEARDELARVRLMIDFFTAQLRRVPVIREDERRLTGR